MKKTLLDLVKQLEETTNPVTRWSLRGCIFERILLRKAEMTSLLS